MNELTSNSYRGVGNVLIAAAIVAMIGSFAVADSFMSSPDFVQTDGGKESGQMDKPPKPTIHEMLAAMEWKGAEHDGDTFDLGNGVHSPQAPSEALLWCAENKQTVGPRYRFLALYKANWDYDKGDLLAKMQQIKTNLAFRHHPDAAEQAVMALGIALASLQLDYFGSDSLDSGLVARYAGSAFAEAIGHTRAITDKKADERKAIAAAVRSGWTYIQLYKDQTAALERYLTSDALKWLNTDR